MIALGWTRAGGPLPSPVLQRRQGAMGVLYAKSCQMKHARDRLAFQVKCFGAGIDLLPVAPHHTLDLQSAIDMSTQRDVSKQLDQLAGFGQLTLALASPEPSRCEHRDGRGWLAARKAQHDELQRQAQLLRDLAAHTGLPTSLPHSDIDTRCHLLIKRHRADALKSELAKRAKAYQGAANATIFVTGLWPPYNFVDGICDRSVAA